MIIHGDSLEGLKGYDDNHFDAVITDPPYGLSACTPANVKACLRAWLNDEAYTATGGGFMSKTWDNWVPSPTLWSEVYRVLKHGGHALIFAGSRTQDLMGLSLRLAGFEVRDVLQWIYGSGFPKSHNVALSIDKKLGGANRGRAIPRASSARPDGTKLTSNPVEEYKAKSEPAKRYEGYGTALKPAYEPILLVRKPLAGTVAENVLAYGTGGLNIDGCRVNYKSENINFGSIQRHKKDDPDYAWNSFGKPNSSVQMYKEKGRWPANVIFDEQAKLDPRLGRDSRFFYSPKPSTYERHAGVNGNNVHPTVKPIDLMRYLIRLITPPNGVVLEPFAGSGTTLCAAVLEGVEIVGIEREAEYIPIIESRVDYWSGNRENVIAEDEEETGQLKLF